jgi:putative ABC transport system permease protein
LGAVLIGAVTMLFLVLVVLLSLRLRQAEMDTMFKLGCSRQTMVWLQAAELSIVLGISLAAAGVLSWATWMFGTDLIRQMLLR